MRTEMQDYVNFVDKVTSAPSKNKEAFLAAVEKLYDDNVDVARVITSCIGMAGEVGEYNDLFKKVLFQGKEFTPEVKTHLKKELGDIGFYWVEACIALEENPMEILKENKAKLESRYPEGFSVAKSENRKSTDI